MAGPLLYSANPWIAHDIADRYLGGVHRVWCSEYFDPKTAPASSAAALIGPSSSPKAIFYGLWEDCDKEDTHSHVIRSHRRTFRALATDWFSAGRITEAQRNEILATVKSSSWKIWRPVLYVIPRAPIEAASRLNVVPLGKRAAYGGEYQIEDLHTTEFDIVEVGP